MIVFADRLPAYAVGTQRAVRTNTRRRTVNSTFHTYLDVIHFQKTTKCTHSAPPSAEREASTS